MTSKYKLAEWIGILSTIWFLWLAIAILLLPIDWASNNIAYANISLAFAPSKKLIKKTNPGFPTRLKIIKIKVDASIQQLWLTPNWAMDTTKGAYDLAWFKLGPLPWTKGSAVVAGHYWKRKNGNISVFHDLDKLKKWDKVIVEDDNWKNISFIVRKSKVYSATANTSEVFISNDNKSHLNLITCHGIWDTIAKTYHQRLVVFTDKQ